MSIFGRIGTLLKANINDLISKSEDPEKILNQLILDMKEQLINAKKQVAVAIADEKRLRKQLDSEVHKSNETRFASSTTRSRRPSAKRTSSSLAKSAPKPSRPSKRRCRGSTIPPPSIPSSA